MLSLKPNYYLKSLFSYVKRLFLNDVIIKYSIILFRFLLLLGVLAFLLFIVWYLPEIIIPKNLEYITRGRIELINEQRRVLLQILGGAVVLFGLYLTYRRLKSIEKNVHIAEQGQLTDRFSRAVEHLGSDKLDIRLGGVYSLQRIAWDSKYDYWTIMEILSTYIRGHCPVQSEKRSALILESNFVFRDIKPEIQAIINVIKKRIWTKFEERENKYFDLSYSDLSKYDLKEILLTKANLVGVNFQETDLREANFQMSDLTDSNLKYSSLFRANLASAYLIRANLSNAFLFEVNLETADLRDSNLQDSFLIYTNLKGALLLGANLKGANLTKANFEGADLRQAILQNVEELSVEQISKAGQLKGIKLDRKILKELEQKYPEKFNEI